MRVQSSQLQVQRYPPFSVHLSGLRSLGDTSVQVLNSSRPGQTFQVGDSFTVKVTGAPNSPVTLWGTQNGNSMGTTPVGNTDASGNFTLSGSMTADTVGAWSEIWSVGGNPAPALIFSVAAVPVSSPAPVPSAIPSSSPAVLTTPATPAPATSSTGSSTGTTWLTQSTLTGNLFGGYVPNWMVLAAVGAVGLLMLTRGKR